MTLFLAITACRPEPAAEPVPADTDTGQQDDPLPPPGDPERGRHALLNEGYVRCGIPRTAFDMFAEEPDEDLLLPDREGANAELEYYYTAFTTDAGVELVTNNCLFCHADYDRHSGSVVVGLGNASLDFTDDASQYAELVPLLEMSDAEREEAERWSERVVATAPSIVTDTIGANPADALAQALFAHRDPATLAWHQDPLLPLPTAPIPTDVPPWWGMYKKSAMLYTGAGQGNLARILMTASALCTDTTDEADQIYDYFPDIYAYLASLRAPPFPEAVDTALAAEGERVFSGHCAACHGTYGEDWTYPGLVIPASEVGTDPVLAGDFDGSAAPFLEWFAASWYGQDAQLVATGGYVAPPLDGIWITGPYLHNGSVPSLQTLLDSATRPVYWRTRRTPSIDPEIGMSYSVSDESKEESGGSTAIVDTTLPGWNNAGHTYGDALTDSERVALIEYLKTL